MEDQSTQETPVQAKPTAKFAAEGPSQTGNKGETTGKPLPTPGGIREKVDELYERYGDDFRRLR